MSKDKFDRQSALYVLDEHIKDQHERLKVFAQRLRESVNSFVDDIFNGKEPMHIRFEHMGDVAYHLATLWKLKQIRKSIEGKY